MSFKYLIAAFFLLFTFVTPAFAGGGPVALYAFPLKPFDSTKAFILQAEVYSTQPCSEIKPTFTFKDSRAGDKITPYNPPTDGTYITRHYNTGQPNFEWKEICDTYAQAISGSAEQRTIVVNVMVDGENEVRETKVAYGNDSYSKELQSFGRVNDADNTPHVDVVSEKYLGGPKREVVIQWQKIPWADKYVVFDEMLDENGNRFSSFGPYPSTTETKAILNINAFYPYYLTVKACRADDTCDKVGENPYLILLDKMRNVDGSMVNPVISNTQSNTTKQQTEIVPLPTTENQAKLEELNRKVSELEGKLQKSEEKQALLERTVNVLMDWIRARFPFFGR